MRVRASLPAPSAASAEGVANPMIVEQPNEVQELPEYQRLIEVGVDRGTLAFLCDAYHEDEVGGEARTVLKLHPRLAPIKAAVFPLVKKDGMPEKALAIYRSLKRHFNVYYDEKGAIGRRYRRQDEAGTPFCITVDTMANQYLPQIFGAGHYLVLDNINSLPNKLSEIYLKLRK